MTGFAEFIRFTSMGGLDFRSLYHNKGTPERWPYFEAAIRLPPGQVADVFPISQLPLHKSRRSFVWRERPQEMVSKQRFESGIP